ncbi:hypothetical protein SPBR_08016 [Sporothrix brasiliensis 5110]|uniref:Ribosome assembly protein 3 n=1 Tax=Sporothrix brasiliensis 5110 TaxID=1398154 RepID=A0A0C2FCV6_9PEZI|nr:uncharacterized protein SPBR_08016 [Sporothrix brasiliensis 5110]KIH88988.1 hypothetical protein SPBR_08016 [Sporothrix brasiliensis 5110]
MSSDSTNQAFQAFYLQHTTAELAEDLDQLRTSADFVLPGQESVAADDASAAGVKAGAKSGVTDTDNSLQLLIGALRQGTAMFSAEDQARVVVGKAGESS